MPKSQKPKIKKSKSKSTKKTKPAVLPKASKQQVLPKASNQKPAQHVLPTASTVKAATPTGTRQMISWDQMRASSLNPRNHFDAEKIAALAESIARDGVLQNLTVRKHPKEKDAFEIVAGESRWRAVGLLVKAKRAPDSYGVPALVKTLTDTELVEMAMAENMARKDLTPMEEARGLAALKKRGVTTREMADRLGVTMRMVQQRLQLVENLIPEAQKALEAGTIKVDWARELARAPADVQKGVLGEIKSDAAHGEPIDARAVRAMATEGMVEVAAAAFEPGLYKGQVVTDDETGEKWFADRKEFMALQKQAAELKAADIKTKNNRAWVKVVERFWNDEHNHVRQPKNPKAGVVVCYRDDTKDMKIYDGVIHQSQADDTQAKTRPTKSVAQAQGKAAKVETSPLDNITKPHLFHAAARKTLVLADHIAKDPIIAMRVCVIGMLGAGGETVHLKSLPCSVPAPTVQRLLAALDGLAKDAIEQMFDALTPGEDSTVGAPLYDDDLKRVWDFVFRLDVKRLQELFMALVAAQCRATYDHQGDDEALLALHDNAPLPPLPLTIEDTQGLRKPALMGICRRLKTAFKDTMTASQLRELIGAELKKGKSDVVLPTLMILDADGLKTAVAKLLGD
jgi:ParB family transcriptional regulator, chromosome partitioning protein